MHMIIGLGNPGHKYEATKHNVGFWVIDTIASQMGISVEKKQCQALTQTGFFAGKKVLLVKPQTFMNLSGQAVNELLHYYGDQIEDLIVIHDDLDLSPGHIRLKQGGGAGGHNGIKSIAQHLNSNDFDRLKIGIGRGKNAVSDYVLTEFAKETKQLVDPACQMAVEAVAFWMEQGMAKAMNQYNKKQ